jgi:hypothetical protein
MKHIIFLLISLHICCYALSQENDSVVVVQSRVGRLSGLIDIQDLVNEGFSYWDEEFKGHWAGVDFGFNSFAHTDYSSYPTADANFLANNWLKSNILNINLLQYSLGIQKTRTTIGLVTGVGLSIQSFRLDNNTTITLDENRMIIPDYHYLDPNQKSKLSMVYLDVPLLLEFQVPIRNKANRMYLSAGVVAMKRLESHTKFKFRNEGKREKLKSPGDYSLRDYKIGSTVRVGYRWLNLFATYDLVSMFEDRRGPVLYPFTFGFKLLTF